MLLEVYDYKTLEVLGVEQQGEKYRMPTRYEPEIYDRIRNKYGGDAFSRPYVDPNDFGFRNPTQEEVVPGFECLIVEDPQERAEHWYGRSNSAWGTTIRVDSVKYRVDPYSGNPVTVVFYHCIDPAWSGQCFVPMSDFLNKPSFSCGGSTVRRWVKK